MKSCDMTLRIRLYLLRKGFSLPILGMGFRPSIPLDRDGSGFLGLCFVVSALTGSIDLGSESFRRKKFPDLTDVLFHVKSWMNRMKHLRLRKKTFESELVKLSWHFVGNLYELEKVIPVLPDI